MKVKTTAATLCLFRNRPDAVCRLLRTCSVCGYRGRPGPAAVGVHLRTLAQQEKLIDRRISSLMIRIDQGGGERLFAQGAAGGHHAS